MQIYIQPVLGFGHSVIRNLHIPERSPLTNLITLTIAFAISDFFHILSLAVIRDENLSLQELTINMSSFFMMQPVAAVAEMFVIKYHYRFTSSTTANVPTKEASYEKLHRERESYHKGKPPSAIARIGGYIWVLCWFSMTGWGFTKAYVAVGVRDWQVPLSFWQVFMVKDSGKR